MATKAELVTENNELRAQRNIAQENSLNGASVRDLSSALLNKLDSLRDEAIEQKDEAERKVEALETAYDDADSVDDAIIALEDI